MGAADAPAPEVSAPILPAMPTRVGDARTIDGARTVGSARTVDGA